jgi:hypothetical protein
MLGLVVKYVYSVYDMEAIGCFKDYPDLLFRRCFYRGVVVMLLKQLDLRDVSS